MPGNMRARTRLSLVVCVVSAISQAGDRRLSVCVVSAISQPGDRRLSVWVVSAVGVCSCRCV